MDRQRIKIDEGIYESLDPGLKRAFEFTDQTVPDSIKSQAAYKMAKDKVKLSGDGTFYTLQGEGPTMGLPCVFVRLHFCNLRCTWCDAWYTWNPNTKEFWTEPRDIPIAECADLIRNTWDGNNNRARKRVVWTGGEPLVQRKQMETVSRLLGASWYNEVETNGTILPTEFQLETYQFNCSPKLSNSLNERHSMVKPKIIKRLNSANTTFKFVVTRKEDLDEIEKWYGDLVDHDKIIIMPQGVTADEVHINAQKVAEYVKEKEFRLMGRLQNEIWGARRAV